MKVTLLGGGGFIGSSVIDCLLSKGYKLRILDQNTVMPHRDFNNSENIEWIKGDLNNESDLNNALDGSEVLIHLISTTSPKTSSSDPLFDIKSNLLPFVRLLEITRKKEIKKIIFISSGGTVYGVPEYLPISESHPTNPRVSYGIVKLAMEKFLMLESDLYGFQACILRVSNPYGERQKAGGDQGVIASFVYKAIKGEPLDIWGGGEITRDFIYVGDVAEAVAASIQYKGTNSIFNISSGDGVSINSLVQKLECAINKKIKVEKYPSRNFDVLVNTLDNTLARNELGWIPKTSLEYGLPRTIRWMSEYLSKENKSL